MAFEHCRSFSVILRAELKSVSSVLEAPRRPWLSQSVSHRPWLSRDAKSSPDYFFVSFLLQE